ncbi:MAG: universal stress protein [SAR324 cluster bacterium]|nr:universal stress protein [SAR324 cluster bacterium]
MLRKILVPLDCSAYTPAAVRFASSMAKGGQTSKAGGVSIVGLSVVDTDQFPVGKFASIVPREELLKDARQKAEQLMNDFRSLTATLGLKKALVEAHMIVGSPFREIIRHGVFCDLIVMTRTCSFPPVQHDYDTLTHLYHRSSRPIVIASEEFRPVRKVIMAMNGTAPASRLMYAYAQLNAFPDAKLKVVYSKKEQSEYHLGEFFENVKAYFKSYGYKVELAGLGGNFEQKLAAEVKKDKAELLAMGIPAEHIIDKFRETLRLKTHPVQQMLDKTGTSLFTVH